MNLDRLQPYPDFFLDLAIVLLIAMTLWLCGCSIPVVGNSPEEIQHRKQLEEHQKAGQFSEPKP